MRLYEILNEAISLTAQKARAKKAINSAIENVMTDLETKVTQKLRDKSITTREQMLNYVREYITYNVPPRIESRLGRAFIRDANNKSWVSSVRFYEINDNYAGYANGSTIVITRTLLDKILKTLIEATTDLNGDFIFYDDGGIDMSAVKGAFRGYKDWRWDDDIQEVVTEIIDTFIHELVHVTQHSKQSKLQAQGKYTEYRSYLTKNKERFYQAVRELATEYDRTLYYASPQEIPAHAHNMALDIINMATNGWDIEQMDDINDIDAILFNLRDAIKDGRNWEYNDRFERYKRYNDPKNVQHYKVFKRFLTAVYKEVDRYIDQVKKRQQELKDEAARQKDLDDWWDSQMVASDKVE